MKKLLIVTATILLLVSCRHTTGSGNIITETRNTESFDAISVGGSFDVEVKMGDTRSVQVEADDNIMEYIQTRVSGNTLKISTENLHSYSNVHMKVYVTVTELKAISASASAEVKGENVLRNNEKLVFKASSSSIIKAEVDAPEIVTDANSSATIEIRGRTKTHTSEVSSSAEIKAFNLLSENTTATASSSGSMEVHASVSLNAKASSSGDIEYKGGATVSKSENSSGSVEKRD